MFGFGINKNSDLTVHRQLVVGLKTYAMQLDADSRMPSESKLCHQFYLARMTVSGALNELVKDNVLYRIKGKGTFVKKQQRKVESIKFLLPGPGCLSNHNPDANVIQRYLAGMLHEAHKENIRVETVICTADHKNTSLQPEQFSSFDKDDNVFVLSQWWHPVFPALAASGCNVVYENNQRMSPEFESIFSNWYLLTNDVVGAASDAVSYFARMGRKKILGFNILDSQFDCPDPRTIGYRQGLELNNIAINENLMPIIAYDAYNNPESVIELIVNAYKKAPFNAVILPSYCFAKLFQTALIERLGLSCPDDVAMVSLQDNEINIELPVPVSAMSLAYYELGIEAVKAFSRGTFTAGEKKFAPKLIERESSQRGAGATSNPDFLENINNLTEHSVLY
ncbi:MAG: GntR family transcriptional regulator [Victivallaceae bacterium]|nr:GntR family transcriptional regulator [Victivallaceae bacterium]